MNVPELRAAIARSGETNRSIAKHLDISEQALNKKIKGETEFKSSEIKTVAQVLSLSLSDVNLIFFDEEVN